MASTRLLYLDDSYLKEFDARVAQVRSDGGIVLDQTGFYYTSGGQPCDLGRLVCKADGREFSVKEVRKLEGEVVHLIEGASDLAPGDALHGLIDWPRRHRHMRMHTAGHALGAILYSKGALITGNQLGAEQSRFDFSLENFDRALIESCLSDANSKLAQGRPVRISYLPREEALKLPGMVKLAAALPPDVRELRIVEIEGIDTQADGGTHVANTSEVGALKLLKLENKGSTNRRIYFGLDP